MPQHCADCHSYIVNTSDHSTVCGLKGWTYKREVYVNLAAKPLIERAILSFSSSFRVLKNNSWSKGNDGEELCSSPTGAVFRFISNTDLCLLSVGYTPVRIVVVVKDANGECFNEKLMLLTSPQRFMVATDLDHPFNRNANVSTYTTLVLAVSATGLIIDVNTLGKSPRNHKLLYDGHKFVIPDELKVDAITPAPAPAPAPAMQQPVQNTEALRNEETPVAAPAPTRAMQQPIQNALVLRNEETSALFCSACYRVHRANECDQRPMEKCVECHIIATKDSDHLHTCNFKWYTSVPIAVYVKLPVVRCTVKMDSPIYWQRNQDIQKAYNGLVLASPMADAYFRFDSDRVFELATTGFTRIRVPFVVHQATQTGTTLDEKLILLTSHDRTVIVAKGSRQVSLASVVDDAYLHNTPLVLHNQPGGNPSLTLTVYGVNRSEKHRIPFDQTVQKFVVPAQLDVKTYKFLPLEFDAPVPKKKK